MPTANDLAMAWESLRSFLGLILSWSLHALAMAWGTAFAVLAWPFANMTSANWAAIAAMFAALSSFLALSVQRRNLLESVRPELMLLDWGRQTEGVGDGAHERISFRTIRNVGRGAAFHMTLNCEQTMSKPSIAFMGTIQLPILAAGESTDANGQITVWFKNVESSPHAGGKHLLITVKIPCWDSRNIRHETRYTLLAVELPWVVTFVAHVIAPGVALTTRRTRARPVWRLRLWARLARIPGLGTLFRER
jgi:hypothetical protein